MLLEEWNMEDAIAYAREENRSRWCFKFFINSAVDYCRENKSINFPLTIFVCSCYNIYMLPAGPINSSFFSHQFISFDMCYVCFSGYRRVVI